MFGKKKMTADDLLENTSAKKEEAKPKTEDQLQDKIARVLGALN